MPLFVKGTEEPITGVMGTIQVIQTVSGLDDDGLPILEDNFALCSDPPELEIRDNSLVFVTPDGDTYTGSAVVDRPNSAVERAYVGIGGIPARKITPHIETLWRERVRMRRTHSGLKEWAEDVSSTEWISFYGFYARSRDWLINQAHVGQWQVTEHYQPGTVTDDASEGSFFAIVGDDLESLIAVAMDHINNPM